eukprot:CAMPEP_0184697504 /NCGR_PEP_ID=MMETSP0313-20130426/4454_1 /TAXON_ID=2792 /ORGANISM="Porphyridium aerugineum, Strain SAG 1380-2" /LENGTH=844 /DNA_ID=CAMNT_0027156313 /DNA_START=44 /DNA_END=2575 /DNA_ORIENTATION=-
MSESMHDSSAAASSQAMSASASTLSSQQVSPEKWFPASEIPNNNNNSASRRLSFGSSRRNSGASSDSLASSPAVESQESVSSEGSWAFSLQCDTSESETDNDRLTENGTSAWTHVDVPGMIRLTLRSRDKDRMENTEKEIHKVLTNIKYRCGVKSNERLTRETCLRFFLTNYLFIVANYAEEMRITHSIREHPVEFDEVCEFFRIVMISMFYRVAPGVLFDKGGSVYGLMGNVNQQRQRFASIWKLLQLRREDLGRDSCILDSFIDELQECVSKSVNVCFTGKDAVVSLDDDKLPFTKNNARELGLKSFKIKERCSAVQHCLVSLNTRLFLGGHLNALNESHKDCVNCILANVSGIRVKPMEMLPESLLVTMDRAYSHVALDPDVTVATLTTVKRGRADFPFTFGKKNTSRGANGPRHVRMDGVQAMYFATRQNSAFAVAWRDQERVTLLQTTENHITPGDWDYVPIDSSLLEYQRKTTTPAYLNFLPNRQVLTINQRTSEWFVAKRFQLTSTVVYPILHLWTSGFAFIYNQRNENEAVSLDKVDKLGKFLTKRSCAQGADESRKALLKGMTRAQLMDLAKVRHVSETAIRASWKKGRMVDVLLQHLPMNDPVFNPLQDTTTLEQQLLDSWFKKGSRAKHFQECLENENRVRRQLKDFVNCSNTSSADLTWAIVDIQEIGLARSVDLEGHKACASLDGIVLLSRGRSTALCGLEIKTRISRKEMNRILAVRETIGRYHEVRLNFHSTDSSIFQQFVPDPQYRIQLLHHIASCSLDRIMYVEATKTDIVYVVVFDFAISIKTAYVSHFLRPIGGIIQNMMDEIEQLNPESEFCKRLNLNYLVDAW